MHQSQDVLGFIVEKWHWGKGCPHPCPLSRGGREVPCTKKGLRFWHLPSGCGAPQGLPWGEGWTNGQFCSNPDPPSIWNPLTKPTQHVLNIYWGWLVQRCSNCFWKDLVVLRERLVDKGTRLTHQSEIHWIFIVVSFVHLLQHAVAFF